MRFAVTAKYKKLCAQFENCTEFAIMDVSDNAIVSENFWSSPPHEFGNLPEWLRYEMKVSLVVTNSINHKMQQLLTEKGIKVVTGAMGESPREVVENYLNRMLVTDAAACDN